MKIQFGEKGEVPWDVLLEAVQNEQRQQESEQFQNRKSLCSRIRKRCCDSWLTLAILVSVVLAAQAWVLLYFTMGCASVYKLGCDYSDEAWVLLSLRWVCFTCCRSYKIQVLVDNHVAPPVISHVCQVVMM
nr:uncharacterized protein LOC113811532 [Penaeus vannamei]